GTRTSPHAKPGAGSASFAMSSMPPPVASTTVLPLGHEEIAPDGLPANAMRCTQDGGILKCGSCSTDSDCQPGQGCVPNRETRRFECMSTECEQDAHCFPGFTCRAVTSGTTGPIIRRCVPVGVRREGETCDSLYTSPTGACGEGLRCISQV